MTTASSRSGVDNRGFYETAAAVRAYAAASELYPPEAAILARLGGWLAHASMLDIGVGGGRTTVHFAPRVARYQAIDYSEAMVEACRRRFEDDEAEREVFAWGDARDLSFPDASFDLVLFSFQGLDALDADDRRRALAEIARVCRPEGRFVFSFHNLAAVDRMLSPWRHARALVRGAGPARAAARLARRMPVHVWEWLANPPGTVLRDNAVATVVEGWPWSAERYLHLRPDVALGQVEAFGFDVEAVLDAEGTERRGPAIEASRSLWLTVLARRRPERSAG